MMLHALPKTTEAFSVPLFFSLYKDHMKGLFLVSANSLKAVWLYSVMLLKTFPASGYVTPMATSAFSSICYSTTSFPDTNLYFSSWATMTNCHRPLA